MNNDKANNSTLNSKDIMKQTNHFFENLSIKDISTLNNNNQTETKEYKFIMLRNADLSRENKNLHQYIIKLEAAIQRSNKKYFSLEQKHEKSNNDKEDIPLKVILDKINFDNEKLENELVNFKLKFAEKSEENLRLFDLLNEANSKIMILNKLLSEKDIVIRELSDKLRKQLKSPDNNIYSSYKQNLFTDSNNFQLESTDIYSSNNNQRTNKTAGEKLTDLNILSNEIMSVKEIIENEKRDLFKIEQVDKEKNKSINPIKSQVSSNIKLSSCISEDVLPQIKKEKNKSFFSKILKGLGKSSN